MTTDIASAAERLPRELRLREHDDADLERVVEFQNRWASPAQWQAPASVRHMESIAPPEPNRLRLLVEDGGRSIVATAGTSDGGMFSAPDGSFRMSLRVDPVWRRRGVGSSLLQLLEGHARDNKGSRLVTAVRGNEPEGARFAEARGFSAFHERIDAYLDVSAFDPSRFDDPDAIAARSGIRLATYEELVGEHAGDLDAFQRHIIEVMWPVGRDVPSPIPMPEQPPPFPQAKRMFFDGPGQDPGATVYALRDGKVVGMSVTAVKENGTAYTNMTGVARDERNKGIALAMKLRAIRALKARGIQLFGTTNDDRNAAMRGINRRLGYVPDAPTVMYEKKLT